VGVLATTTTSETCEPPRDAPPIFQTPAEGDAQTLTVPSIEQEGPACVVFNEKFDRAVQATSEERGSVANEITQIHEVVYAQTKELE
jgi:hypothetical protein